ncbi:MAG TPA: GNAT family N-acetyltransferase, partial [Vicinamibacterales bacterium]|nr:GNAT family N-acetyltransferase [Vicinamibacterales bacterium]
MLRAPDLPAAAGVLGRGMRDNPLHVRVFGADPARREARLTALFTALLRRQHLADGVILGAFHDRRLVGVCGMIQPGRCRPTLRQKLQLLPALVSGRGLGLTIRVVNWTSQWARRDPDERHWHLGPVAVERDLQGRGVGSALLTEVCARMDALGSDAYLETDKPENVVFYERFGFQTVGDEVV